MNKIKYIVFLFSGYCLLYADSNIINYFSPRPVVIHYTANFDEKTLTQIIKEIESAESIDAKLAILTKSIANHPEGFNSDQVIRILKSFEYDLPMIEAIQILNAKIYGLSNEELITILKEFKVEKLRFQILSLLSKTLYEDINETEILNLFKNKANKDKALKIVESFHKRSPIFGEIDGKNILFMIDFSGSMSQKFQTTDGNEVTRLQFLIEELSFVFENHLKSSMQFNIILFNDQAIMWQPALAKVNKSNVKAGIQFLSTIQPNGGTNIERAIQISLSNKNVDTIYLLSDGIDNPSPALYSSIKKYSEKIKFNTINFLMGKNESEETRSSAKKLLYDIAKMSGGVLRVVE